MASIIWFRVYHEARNDAKLRALTDAQHRTWFHLLCFASEQMGHRGVIEGYSDSLLAVEVCNGDTDLLRETLQKLESLQVVTVVTKDEASVTFINFANRQYDSPSDRPQNVAERVARHRVKVAVEAETISPSYINGTVTTLKRGVTKSNDTDTDTDTDTDSDKERIYAAPNGAEKKASRKQREPTEHDHFWEAFATAIGTRPESRPELAKWGTGIKAIRDAGVTLEEIPAIVRNYRARCPTMPCNPAAIASHLSDYRGTLKPHSNGSRAVDRSELAGGVDYIALYDAKRKREQEERDARAHSIASR